MRPEDGCLWVYGVGEDGVPAFTRDGMAYYSRSSPTKELPTAHHRRSTRPNDPACAFHRMLTPRAGPRPYHQRGQNGYSAASEGAPHACAMARKRKATEAERRARKSPTRPY